LEPDETQRLPVAGEPAATPATAVNSVEFAIGPEGGFAPEELEALRLSGFTRIGLGPRVLRTETAAIAALVMLQTRFGDMCPQLR
jgi:16S rRNA (uracil1498-N3)-methyltransferase